MQHFEEIWRFQTARFAVIGEAAPEADPQKSISSAGASVAYAIRLLECGRAVEALKIIGRNLPDARLATLDRIALCERHPLFDGGRD